MIELVARHLELIHVGREVLLLGRKELLLWEKLLLERLLRGRHIVRLLITIIACKLLKVIGVR